MANVQFRIPLLMHVQQFIACVEGGRDKIENHLTTVVNFTANFVLFSCVFAHHRRRRYCRCVIVIVIIIIIRRTGTLLRIYSHRKPKTSDNRLPPAPALLNTSTVAVSLKLPFLSAELSNCLLHHQQHHHPPPPLPQLRYSAKSNKAPAQTPPLPLLSPNHTPNIVIILMIILILFNSVSVSVSVGSPNAVHGLLYSPAVNNAWAFCRRRIWIIHGAFRVALAEP